MTVRNKKGSSAVVLASSVWSQGGSGCVAALIKGGANANTRMPLTGMPLLMVSDMNEDIAVARLLE